MAQADAYVIAAADLSPWTSRLMARAEVVAPTAISGAEAAYDVVESSDRVAWEYKTSVTSLKRFLFPQQDPMFRWYGANGSVRIEPFYDEAPRIFLGVRSCDACAIAFLDTVFSRDRDDVYYLARRQHTTVVTLSCSEPGENCFCICAHAGPFLDAGYDLQLTRLSDGSYLAEVGTEKGAGLLAGEGFRAAPEALLRERANMEQRARDSFGEDKSYFAAALRKITFDRVDDELWTRLGERCLGCGGCSFVCPTCSCFTTVDAAAGGEMGVRERLWDSCLYETYALEASGHNPRAERRHRVKARFFHKLSYQFVQRTGGVHGCVGCGRCITACLGGNDMPVVTAAIRQGSL